MRFFKDFFIWDALIEFPGGVISPPGDDSFFWCGLANLVEPYKLQFVETRLLETKNGCIGEQY